MSRPEELGAEEEVACGSVITKVVLGGSSLNVLHCVESPRQMISRRRSYKLSEDNCQAPLTSKVGLMVGLKSSYGQNARLEHMLVRILLVAI